MKQFFIFLLVLLLAGSAAAWYKGIRPADISAYWSSLQSGNTAEVIKEKRSGKTTFPPDHQKVTDERLLDVQPLPKNPFAKIDAYAGKCPETEAVDIPTLATYLQKEAKSDLEKARSIFIWLTKNINYDDDGFNGDLDGDYSAEGVLASRKGVCEGFSNLFLALGNAMALDIEKVTGYAKGYGYHPGDHFKEVNHAWNVIRIGGQPRIFDATWGEGYGSNINGKLVSTKTLDDYWFNVDPYEAIFSHFPKDQRYSFVVPVLNLATYEHIPEVDKNYFRFGFNGAETFKALQQNNNLQFPECYTPKSYVIVKNAPAYAVLKRNQTYSLVLYVPRAIDVAVVDPSNNFFYFEREKGIFTLNYTPESKGEVQIAIRYFKDDDSFHTAIQYTVE